MKKLCFSGLISCGMLLAAAQTNGQSLFGYVEDNIIILHWTAANEKFVDHYTIEHSTDSIHFSPMHDIVSKAPFTDAAENTYEDADTYPANAVNFYRLHTTLKDGGDFYSPVTRVDLDARDLPVLKPTVLHQGGTLHLDNYHSNQLLTINIFNANGTLVGSYLVNGNTFNLSTDRLAKGILFYRISDETHPLIDAGKLMVQ